MTGLADITPDFFVAGGALKASAQSYVQRPADEDLFHRALEGEFCFVLTPRQMGKTSLMVRTKRRLESEGVKTVIIDLTSIGTQATPDQWYLSILNQIARAMRLQITAQGAPVSVQEWWEAHQAVSNVQRMSDFLYEQVVCAIPNRVVIFFDEIDTTLSLDFRDDFFAGIRALYNRRTVDPDLDRLTFVLLGVASPSDLIKDSTRTPFNIGQAIRLNEFSREDAQVLRDGLVALYPERGEAIFQRIFDWTNGHPYLTQKLCLSVAESPEKEWSTGEIDELVQRLFLADEVRNEANLKFVQDRILSHPQSITMLRIYRKVVLGKQVQDNGQSIPINELKLAGLVEEEKGCLVIRNKIYSTVFNRQWVRRNLPTNWTRIWVSSSVGLLALGLILLIVNYIMLPIQRDQTISRFYQAENADSQVSALAGLYDLHGLIIPVDYDDTATALFYSLPRGKQDGLFQPASSLTSATCGSYAMVVRKLYTSLADVQRGNQTGPLLGEMQAILDKCGKVGRGLGFEDSKLYNELYSWSLGREAAHRTSGPGSGVSYDDLTVALAFYNKALEANSTNPATLYERAQVYVALGSFDLALADLSAILARLPAKIPATPTPTATQESSPTVVLTTTGTATVTALSAGAQQTATQLAAAANQNQAGPGGQSACQPPSGWTPYTVRAGDTLDGLAGVFGVSADELARGNCLTNGSLVEGNIVYIPPVSASPTPPAAPPEPRRDPNEPYHSNFSTTIDILAAVNRLIDQSRALQNYIINNQIAKSGKYPILERYNLLPEAVGQVTPRPGKVVTTPLPESGTPTIPPDYKGGKATSAPALSPTPAPTIKQGVQASFPAYVITDGLAMRTSPAATNDNLLKRLPINTRLVVLETDDSAKQKIGVQGQWLAVLDPGDGTQGYVAAWFLATQPAAQQQATSGFAPTGPASTQFAPTGPAGSTATQAPLGQAQMSIADIPVGPVSRFLADGTQVLSPSKDGAVIEVWNTRTGLTKSKLVPSSPALALDVSPDGKWIASGNQDGSINLWDAAQSAAQAGPSQPLKVFNQGAAVRQLLFTPDGKRLAAGSDSGQVFVFDVAAQQELFKYSGSSDPVTALTINTDGRFLAYASASTPSPVHIFDLTTFQSAGYLLVISPVLTLALSADGSQIAVGSLAGGFISAVTTDTGAAAQSLKILARDAAVTCMLFNPDGTRLFVGGYDQYVTVWDMPETRFRFSLTYSSPVLSLAVGPDGITSLAGRQDNLVWLGDLKRGTTEVAAGHSAPVTFVAIDPTRKYGLSESTDGVIQIIDLSLPRIVTSKRILASGGK